MADSALEQFLLAVAGRAERAAEGARRSAEGASEPAKLRRATVLVASGAVYSVGIMGSSGEVVETIPGVRAWGGSFGVGDRVWIGWEGSRPLPWIVGGGGSGGGNGVYIVFGGLGFAS